MTDALPAKIPQVSVATLFGALLASQVIMTEGSTATFVVVMDKGKAQNAANKKGMRETLCYNKDDK